ncbi:hypothetical protein MASR1M32_01670 [Rhodobacter sp.]
MATELARRLPHGVTARFLGRDEADLMDPAACAAGVGDCDAVINAAAWTAVDKAESEEAAATVVNGDAPAAIARACAAQGLPFLHVSTDYVFDGSGDRPFRPDDPTGPLGAYGRSKLAGEIGVRDSGARALILRTSWVVSAHGANFVKTMLRLGRERASLTVVADQIGGPTPAAAIADALFTAARAMVQGAPAVPTISQARPTPAGPISRARSWPARALPAPSPTFRLAPIPPRPNARPIRGWIAARWNKPSASAAPTGARASMIF